MQIRVQNKGKRVRKSRYVGDVSGELIRLFCIMISYHYLPYFLSIIPHYHTILMFILSEYARYITRREISGNWNSGPENREKGRKITNLRMT